MIAARILCVGMLLLAIVSIAQADTTPPNNIMTLVSCEGQESTGGGVRLYQYEVLNNTPDPITLYDFWVGTDDLNLANYTNWLDPLDSNGDPFYHLVVSDFSMLTDHLKTPHGQNAPLPHYATAGAVWWYSEAGVELPAGTTALFGFNNPLPSEDVGWMTDYAVTDWSTPVAGPLGVFTAGPVHGPAVPEPITIMSTFLALSGLGAYIRRRSQNAA